MVLAARIPPQSASRAGPGVHTIHFVVAPAGGDARAAVREKSTFVVPR